MDPDTECQGGGPEIVDLPPAQRRLAADETWAVTRGGGIAVALVGAGVDGSHPQLVSRLQRGVDVVFPGAFGDADCIGPGTVVAGLVAGSVRSGVGFHGVAPLATIIPIRVTLDGLETTPDLVAAGIEAAIGEGASIVLVTLTTPAGSDRLADAVAAAESAGVLVVAPADPLPAGEPGYTYPATYESVLAVSAIDAAGVPAAAAAGEIAVVDLVAPGEGVIGPLPGRGHTVAITGTLPAAAYVAGAAALVRAAYRDLSPAQVRYRLEVTADHPGRPAPDAAAGWGVVNPVIAVNAEVRTTARVPLIEPADAVSGPQPPRPPDRTTERRALWFGLAGAVAAVVLLVGVKVVPGGRGRGWRPGRQAPPVPPASAG
ncbi:MAG: S8 family serine peptidase [Actinomycetes bacterium]